MGDTPESDFEIDGNRFALGRVLPKGAGRASHAIDYSVNTERTVCGREPNDWHVMHDQTLTNFLSRNVNCARCKTVLIKRYVIAVTNP